jgi:hypothetical protein
VEHDKPDILKWPFKRFSQFVRSGEWRELPATIQQAMVQLWRAEQDAHRSSNPNSAEFAHGKVNALRQSLGLSSSPLAPSRWAQPRALRP